MRYELVKKDYMMKLDDVGGVAVDSKDNVYVALRAPMTPIIIFDKNGDFVDAIGTSLKVRNAHGIDVDAEDNVLIVDGARHVVHKLSRTGELLLTLGNLDTPSLESGAINSDFKTIKRGGPPFYNPAKVATSKACDIYVADGYGNSRVHHFSKDGKLIRSWGEPGKGPGEFHIVHGIGVDQDNGDVYVCDRENLRIQIFDGDGNLKAIWDNLWRPTDVDIRGDYVYVSEIGEVLFTDNVYFDPKYHRHPSQLRVFDKKGNELAKIGTEDGGAPGSFMGAHGICADSSGDIYACEVNNWCRHDAYAAWPNGLGAPTSVHPSFQKFKRID